MKETRENLAGRTPASHIPAFANCPIVRCQQPLGDVNRGRCGERAGYVQRGGTWFDDAYFCSVHRSPDDVPISGDVVVRRVRVRCDLLLSGIDLRTPIAHAEALARLERAVALAGGVLDVREVQSTVGRYPAAAVNRDDAEKAGKG